MIEHVLKHRYVTTNEPSWSLDQFRCLLVNMLKLVWV